MSHATLNQIMDEGSESVFAIEVTDRITTKNHPIYLNHYHDRIKKFGELNLLYYFPTGDFPGWDMEAAKEDILFFVENGKFIKRVATVNAPEKVLQRWDVLKSSLGEIKSFHKNQLQEALSWVHEK